MEPAIGLSTFSMGDLALSSVLVVEADPGCISGGGTEGDMVRLLDERPGQASEWGHGGRTRCRWWVQLRWQWGWCGDLRGLEISRFTRDLQPSYSLSDLVSQCPLGLGQSCCADTFYLWLQPWICQACKYCTSVYIPEYQSSEPCSELEEEMVCSHKLHSWYGTLLQISNASDQFTKVGSVMLRGDTIQECQSLKIYSRNSHALYPLEIFSMGFLGGQSNEPGKYGQHRATLRPCAFQQSPVKTTQSQWRQESSWSQSISPHQRPISKSGRLMAMMCIWSMDKQPERPDECLVLRPRNRLGLQRPVSFQVVLNCASVLHCKRWFRLLVYSPVDALERLYVSMLLWLHSGSM